MPGDEVDFLPDGDIAKEIYCIKNKKSISNSYKNTIDFVENSTGIDIKYETLLTLIGYILGFVVYMLLMGFIIVLIFSN